MNPELSIIIPTYNEKGNLPHLFKRIDQSLPGINYEIIIVDDNSPDGTADMARKLSSSYLIKVIVRQGKLGLGTAVVTGFGNASGDYLAVIDADLQHPPELLSELLQQVRNGSELVVASRYSHGGGMEKWSFIRKLNSRGAIFMSHLLLPSSREISDPMSGFFMLKRKLIEGVDLKPRGYKILLEIAVQAQPKNVSEVGFTFQNRTEGQSKFSVKEQYEYLRHLFSLMRRSGELTRVGKFVLVGGSGILVNEGLLWLMTAHTGLDYRLANAMSIETSIISNFIFNNYFTFADRRNSGSRVFFISLGRFNLVSLIGAGINLVTTIILHQADGLPILVANLIGIVLAMGWNYLANNWWTWDKIKN